MRILNNFRFADKGKVLIDLESLTSSTILPLASKYKEVKEEDAKWEILKLQYDLKED